MPKKLSLDIFKSISNNIHKFKFDYSKVNYITNRIKIIIICPIHGEFEQKPDSHMLGMGCKKCSNRNTSTTEEFIIKSKKIHDDKFDYSLVEYKNAHTKVKIKCFTHGIFEQKPNRHLIGDGCADCSFNKKMNTNEFISKSILKHGNKYDYSISVYKNNKTKLIIKCNIHGEFTQSPNQHLVGNGCPKCSKRFKLSKDDFIFKSNNLHNFKYDYSLIEYKSTKSFLNILCPIHGIFKQYATYHLDGNGCSKCSGKNKTSDEFIKECQTKHNNLYDYDKVEYKLSTDLIEIKCLNHGYFKQKASAHLSGKGCPICKLSKGELFIRNYLLNNLIKYEEEYKFKDCIYKEPLKFDFYLPELNICIEYDGIQHFEIIEHFGGKDRFIYTKKCDNIKNIYCIENKINLIRISYKEINDINDILSKKINIL